MLSLRLKKQKSILVFNKMKRNLFLILVISIVLSCKNDKTIEIIQPVEKDRLNKKHFGNLITLNNAVTIDSLQSQYDTIKIGDSVTAKVIGKVKSVCKAKGCWMILEMKEEEVMVKFKNYTFFVPKNIQEKEVVISGKAYIEEISIQEQQHYAKDEGKSEEELALINTPKRTYLFEADGVLLK